VSINRRLKPPQTAKRSQKTSDVLRVQLAAFGQNDHFLHGEFPFAKPLPDSDEGVEREWNSRDRAAQGDLARLDPPSDLDLFLVGEPGDLPHLLQVETDGVFARPVTGSFEEVSRLDESGLRLLTRLGKGLELFFT
jgi:hypothetical protein